MWGLHMQEGKGGHAKGLELALRVLKSQQCAKQTHGPGACVPHLAHTKIPPHLGFNICGMSLQKMASVGGVAQEGRRDHT